MGVDPDSELGGLPQGTLLRGRYEILRVVGRGAMSVVYSAMDRDDHEVMRAVKEVSLRLSAPETVAEIETWFSREARILRNLCHTAIPKVHDDFTNGSSIYLVMDFVSGTTLEDRLAADGNGYIDEGQVVAWADQILDVLSYLHSLEPPVIFRDLKPANIMLTPKGEVRLIDFGIARVFARRTKGTAIGTPGYSSPEQYQGLAEPGSDLYALGATMHHLLSGRDPRGQKAFSFPPLRSLAPWASPDVAMAIDRALQLDPRRRFDTAADMYRAIHARTPLIDLPLLTTASEQAPKLPVNPIDIVAAGPRVTVCIGLELSRGEHIKLLQNQARAATLQGITLSLALDRCSLDLYNSHDERVYVTTESYYPDCEADVTGAWLQPRSVLRIGLHRTDTAEPARRGRPQLAQVDSAMPPCLPADCPVALCVEGFAFVSESQGHLPKQFTIAASLMLVLDLSLIPLAHVLPVTPFWCLAILAAFLTYAIPRREWK